LFEKGRRAAWGPDAGGGGGGKRKENVPREKPPTGKKHLPGNSKGGIAHRFLKREEKGYIEGEAVGVNRREMGGGGEGEGEGGLRGRKLLPTKRVESAATGNQGRCWKDLSSIQWRERGGGEGKKGNFGKTTANGQKVTTLHKENRPRD